MPSKGGKGIDMESLGTGAAEPVGHSPFPRNSFSEGEGETMPLANKIIQVC